MSVAGRLAGPPWARSPVSAGHQAYQCKVQAPDALATSDTQLQTGAAQAKTQMAGSHVGRCWCLKSLEWAKLPACQLAHARACSAFVRLDCPCLEALAATTSDRDGLALQSSAAAIEWPPSHIRQRSIRTLSCGPSGTPASPLFTALHAQQSNSSQAPCKPPSPYARPWPHCCTPTTCSAQHQHRHPVHDHRCTPTSQSNHNPHRPSVSCSKIWSHGSHCCSARCSGHHAAASNLFRHPAPCLHNSMAALLHTMCVHHLPKPRGQVQAPHLHRAAAAFKSGCQHVDEPILIGRHRLNLQGGNVRARFVPSAYAGPAGGIIFTSCRGQEGYKCIDANPLAGRQAGLAEIPSMPRWSLTIHVQWEQHPPTRCWQGRRLPRCQAAGGWPHCQAGE